METMNYLVVTFFAISTLLLAYIGQRFYTVKKQPMRYFGAGLLFVSLAFLVWTYIVAAHPSDLSSITTLGVIPFIGSFVCFMLAALTGVKLKYRFPLLLTSAAILVSFVLVRFFLFTSNPGFTESGFFAFNVAPVALYFYAMIMAFNFIPALYVVGRHIKHDLLRVFVELGLTLVAVGLIIMVTNTDETLQVVNGVGIGIGLLAAALATTAYGLKKTVK